MPGSLCLTLPHILYLKGIKMRPMTSKAECATFSAPHGHTGQSTLTILTT